MGFGNLGGGEGFFFSLVAVADAGLLSGDGRICVSVMMEVQTYYLREE